MCTVGNVVVRCFAVNAETEKNAAYDMFTGGATPNVSIPLGSLSFHNSISSMTHICCVAPTYFTLVGGVSSDVLPGIIPRMHLMS